MLSCAVLCCGVVWCGVVLCGMLSCAVLNCAMVWSAVVGMWQCIHVQQGAGMSSLSVPMRYGWRALAGQRENNSEQYKLRGKASDI